MTHTQTVFLEVLRFLFSVCSLLNGEMRRVSFKLEI